MALRILLEVTKNSVRIVNHPTDGNLKRVLIPRAGAPGNRAIRLEDGGTGAIPAAPAAGTPNKGNLFVGPAGADDYDTNASRGWAIDLPKKLAERLNRFIHFKSKVSQAGSDDGDSNIDLRKLIYNGALGATGSNTNRFVGKCVPGTGALSATAVDNTAIIIDAVNLPPNQLDNPTDWADARLKWDEYFKFLNVDNVEDLNAAAAYCPAARNPHNFQFELDVFWETEELLENLKDTYDGTKKFPAKGDIEEHIRKLEIYQPTGTHNLGAHDYKHDDNSNVTLLEGGDTTVDAVLVLNTGDPAAGPTNIKKRKELAKKAILNTVISNDGAANDAWYKTTLTNWLLRLREILIWKEVVGLESVEEVLKFNAAGFDIYGARPANGVDAVGTIATNGANHANLDFATQSTATTLAPAFAARATVKDFFPTANKTYLGFKILEDENIEVVPDNGADARDILFGKKGQAKAGKAITFTKTKIDNFRSSVFGTKDEYKNEVDPKKLRGFKPGDIGVTVNTTTPALTDGGAFDVSAVTVLKVVADWENGYHPKGATAGTPGDPITPAADWKKYEDLTKRCFDILSHGAMAANQVNNLDAIIKIAFTENDFNEVESQTPAQLLEMYWNVIRSDKATGLFFATNGSSYDAVKKMKITESAAADDKTKVGYLNKLEAAYKYTKQFVDLLVNKPSKKSDFAAWKSSLKAFLKSGFSEGYKKDLSAHWNTGNKLGDIIDAHETSLPNEIPDDNTKIKDTDVDTAKGEATKDLTFTGAGFKEVIEKIFTDNKTYLVGKDKAILTELKNLIKKIDEAYKNGAEVYKKELKEAYKESSDANKQEAWKLANKVQYENKNLAEEALSKAKKEDKKESDFDKAKTAAETDIKAAMTNGGDEAYRLMISENSEIKTAPQVKQIVKIFKDCCEAWGKKSSDEYSTLKGKLDGYKTSHKDEWKAVNNFKKNGKNEKHDAGFATGALAHLNSFVANRDEDVKSSGILSIESKADADKAVKILREGKSKDDNVVKEYLIPRGELIGSLFEKGGESSKIAKKIRDNFIKKIEEEYSVSTHKENLGKFKELVNELEEYKKKNKSDYESLSQAEKATFNKLVENLKSKVAAMEKEVKSGNKKNNEESNDKGGFWSSGWGITLIVFIILVVLAGVAWLIKANSSSEEGEGESE